MVIRTGIHLDNGEVCAVFIIYSCERVSVRVCKAS